MNMRTRRRTPAALLLGILSGVLAGITILPTSIPLRHRVLIAEKTLQATSTAQTARLAVEIYQDEPLEVVNRLPIDQLSVFSQDGTPTLVQGGEIPTQAAAQACASQLEAVLLFNDKDNPLAIACAPLPSGGHLVIAHKTTIGSGNRITFMVVVLAIIVGILTALGVLTVLRPITRIRSALVKVGQGERGVRLPNTGYGELDDLVEQLNLAARAMELREDATAARLRFVQEMARIVAHEIRNPLQSLELMTSLIAGEESEAERMELADALHQEIRSLDQVVSRLLREGQTTDTLRLHCTSRSLRTAIEQAVSLRSYSARVEQKSIDIVQLVDHEIPIDSALMTRAVEGIIINAIARVAVGTGEVSVSLNEHPTCLELIIDDNGDFNPATDQTVNHQVDNPTKDLSLAIGVVTAHGGELQISQAPTGGRRVSATLPKNTEART